MIFLRGALGPAAVAQPAIDLGSAWGALGDALGFGVLNPPFTPYEVRRARGWWTGAPQQQWLPLCV